LSFLFRPPADDAQSLALLTLGAGVALKRAVAQASGLDAQLKWPNDVVIGQRKLAGILAEGVGVGGSAPVIILGIGINLRRAAHPDEIASRMTSLEDELDRVVPDGRVLEEILVQTRQIYGELRRGGADDILRDWRLAAPSAQGSPVEWQTPQGSRHGITAGIASDGALLVRTPVGVERIVGGEVTWR
jgi:BirA family biotin operon repressor/biotin-[acetyl-CoA-carboxylase] ligase